MPPFTVKRLSVAAIKGTAAQQPPWLRIGPGGADDDRRFVLIAGDGSLVTARTTGRLLLIRASLEERGNELRIWLPDAGTVSGPVERGDASLWDVWGRPTKGWRVAGPFDEALSDSLGFDVRLVEVQERGSAQDDGELTLISTASIDEIARRSGTGALDPRRFRMNFELSGTDRPFEEERWTGRRMSIGSATIQIGETVGRCLVTTLDPATGVKDVDVLRSIASRREPRERGLPLGVFVRTLTPGVVHVGDAAELLP